MTRFIKTRQDKKSKDTSPRKKSGSQKENPDKKKQKCSYHKCKEDAIGRYTIDLDTNGLCYCKKHKTNIGNALLWTILGAEELAKAEMGLKMPKS